MEKSKTVIIGQSDNTSKKAQEAKNLKNVLSKVGVGLAGIAGGALLSSPLARFIGLDSSDTGEDVVKEPILIMHDKAPEATQVTDDMSLKDALAVAREEVGPGGVFTHRGINYSTFTKEEEDVMTPEQKQDFLQSTGEDKKVEFTQVSVDDLHVISIEDLSQADFSDEATDASDVQATEEATLAAETVTETAATFVEPLDEMLADIPQTVTVATEEATLAAETVTETAATFVEPLDEMLADVETPQIVTDVTEEVTLAAETVTETATTFVEPLDEMLADVETPQIVTDATEEATLAAETVTETAATFVEPLDEMLADVETPQIVTDVTEEVTLAAETVTETATTFVEPLDEMLADVETPQIVTDATEEVTLAAETVTETAATFVEPLDEMLADIPQTVTVATEEATLAAETVSETAATFVEPLDEMLADVEIPAIVTEATEEATLAAETVSKTAATFVEPLDEMLASNNNGNYIDDAWVANEDGTKSHLMYYEKEGQYIVKVDQSGTGEFEQSLTFMQDGSLLYEGVDGEETIYTKDELDTFLVEDKLDSSTIDNLTVNVPNPMLDPADINAIVDHIEHDSYTSSGADDFGADLIDNSEFDAMLFDNGF